MLDRLMLKITEYASDPEKYFELFREVAVPSKSVLIQENESIKSVYFVKKGCLRLWFNDHGTDITYQIYFENQPVSGFLDGEKSMFSLESIEPSVVTIIDKKDFENLLNDIPGLKDEFLQYVLQRLSYYSRLFLSRIRDTPAKRYEQLIKEYPEIILRVPQHYIATFLGMTPVSLSRIRNRK